MGAPESAAGAGEVGALRLGEATTYAAGVPHQEIAELRRRSPVAWQALDDGGGFWAVLSHAGVVTVAREPTLFSASTGGVVLEDLPEADLEMMRHMLLAMDPPRHGICRRPLSEAFKRTVIDGLEAQIRATCRQIVDDAVEAGEVELVHEVAARLPTQVMGRLMGLPEGDWDHLHRLSERQTAGQDPEVTGGETDHSASIEMAMYGIELAATRRRQEPRPDLTTLILEGDFGGEPMSDVDFGSFFVQLVTAGNDTTKTMLSSGVLALIEHPDDMDALRIDRSLVPGAVEEILRWANPLHYFRRTATEGTVLLGTEISEGDKVAMWFTAANRDESVFDDPHRFDITRSPNPHLSFGIAEHFCLGVHLARLEGRVFFEELLGAARTIELAGEPVRLLSNLNNSFKRIPVHLAR